MEIKSRILEVLQSGHLMSLATSDENGLWVSDVVYIFDEDLNIYWMSDPDVHHSKSIVKNGQAAGTITISNKSKGSNLGIQFSGIASKIDGPRYDLAKKHLKKRSHPEPKEEDDVLKGDSWYVLKPNKIDLIDEAQWGYDKKSLSL
ncbi:MAG: pyridoxamine 5'-phosphate oxidase family protein [bacterium]|nr:pyridoxamine 5'-phosphate oxidase family protein [bacterium]